jgi:integrase
LGSLRWGDVDLKAASLRVRPTAAKNRKEAILPLPASTLALLVPRRGLPEAPVFGRGVPRTSTLRKDLEAAGIAYKTPAGVLDLHALRVTYATLLGRAGVSLVQAQKLMRHSDPKLTANIYTRLQMDDAREAVAKIDAL